jgi:monoterpene epsilon-lactone hydrolase
MLEYESTVHVPAFDLPISSLLTTETRLALRKWTKRLDRIAEVCPDYRTDVLAHRRYWDEHFSLPLVARFKKLYSVRIKHVTIAGLHTDIIKPAEGVSPGNEERVLINLHGGGFLGGARYGGKIESIPIAALGKITVASVDYRMAPEYKFPAATEDVAAVYHRLLRDHRPQNIGIFGCSAGGLLTAQTVAWLLKKGSPLPGAVGMLFGAGCFWTEGDSGNFRPLFAGAPLEGSREHPYFKDADPTDPLAFPLRSTAILAKFPPSFLVSSTRDHALSSVVDTHSRLVKHGVKAELHVWEGLGHAFFFDPDLRESREVYEVAVKFFARYLGEE